MPKKQATGLIDLRVGLLVAAGIAVLILLILAVSGDISFFKDRVKLKTELAGAEGLKSGDEVRLAGVRVGSVDRVEFSAELPENLNSKSSVVVTMLIDGETARTRIRSDSTVILRQTGLLGGQYLNITPGTRQGDPVRDGDTIKGNQETTIAEVVESSDDLLRGFKQLSVKLNEITETINSGEGTIGRFINDESFYTNLNKVMLEAQQLVERIREGEGTAGKLINDPKLYQDLSAAVSELQTVANQVSKGNGTVGKLLREEEIYTNINQASARLNSVSERLERITAKIDKGEGTVGKLLHDEKLHQDATAAVASVKSIAEKLDRGEGTAGKLLHDEQLYNNLNALSAESVKLLYDFRQNPKKYLSIKVSLF